MAKKARQRRKVEGSVRSSRPRRSPKASPQQTPRPRRATVEWIRQLPLRELSAEQRDRREHLHRSIAETAWELFPPDLGERLLRRDAEEAVALEEMKEQVRREREAAADATPRRVRARGKLSPEALAEHLIEIPLGAVHPDGRPFSVNDRRKVLARKGSEISRSRLNRRLNASK